MAFEVTMPKFGLTMQEGTLQRFFKTPGDPIKAGEALYEVETEKVLYEVEAPAAGTLALWLHEEGATVECGHLVAVIAEGGEDIAELAHRYANGAHPARRAASSAAHDTSAAVAREAAVTTPAPNSASNVRRPISPVARKRSSELGVDLDRVEGTGPGGRVTREDVERAASGAASAATRHEADAAPQKIASPVSRIPLRGMRRTIAARMHQSLRDSAQLTITCESDATDAVDFRARAGADPGFTYTDMIIHAAARALRRHPRMNSRLQDDAILMPDEINVGMAVALEEGLIVPVIRNAERKTLREIGAATRDFGERAREGKLKLEDVSGGTFTVTNLGTWGVDAFTPILNPGETGILGVGRIVEKPAIYRDEITRRSMLTLSLTLDHRVIDGAPAAAFMRTVIEIFNYGER
ncbi:MAG: dihydrolipoamide acetyltransferase family protein [Candidatus Binataceae bacterium]